jgi:hypothetical protein
VVVRRPGGGSHIVSCWCSIRYPCMLYECIIELIVQSSSTTSSPYVSSAFASLAPAALSSSIFCVRKVLISPWRVLSEDWSAARYATRSCVDGGVESAGSAAVKVWGDVTLGDVYVAARDDIVCCARI